MSAADQHRPDEQFIQNAIASFLRIGVLFLIIIYSLRIVGPFINLTIWAMIIAVALYPVHQKLSARLRNRPKLSASILVFVTLLVLLLPVSIMTESTVESARNLSSHLQSGELSIPPPSDKVAGWPLIGEKVHEIWSGAAENLEKTVNHFQPQLVQIGEWLLKAIGGAAGGILAFVVAIFVAGFFMLYAETGYAVACKIMTQLLGKRGEMLTDLSVATIRSVAKGVIGVALIQTLLAAVGFVLVDAPATGILLAIFLLIAIMQLPTLILIGPLVIWVYSVADPMVATIFAIYMLFVSLSDNVLKPLLLGRGVKMPVLVILLGAIGGAIYAGVIGLFIGAVVLALAYELILVWMDPNAAEEALQVTADDEQLSAR